MEKKTLAGGMCLGILAVALSGCRLQNCFQSQNSAAFESTQAQTMDMSYSGQNEKNKLCDRSEDIAELYRDIYEDAYAQNTLSSLETITAIISRLGEYGYAAADVENLNRIDMSCWKQVDEFCRQVEHKKTASTTFFCIMENGGFIRFDLDSTGEAVNVERSVLSWIDDVPKVSYRSSYPAHDWCYTQDGYLFFDEYFPEGYDGAPGYTAIRVRPLDSECRKLNQLYLAPIGYGGNNMFLTDWTEETFDVLDFYDMFQILYPVVMKKPSPYEVSYEGTTYHVPAEIFETVILSCFSIDLDALRKQTVYDSETQSYLYTTRSFYDASTSPNLPYPEVVDYRENVDKTITLTVNAVLPKQHLSQAFCHEVVIRPLENGSFQYVSNHVIPSKTKVEPTWYVDKFTEEERSQIYWGEDGRREADAD